jgi:hypothetical protein
MSRAMEDQGVSWFEEPVSSDDVQGLADVRRQVLPDVAAGEYVYDLAGARLLCETGAVDCLQLDVTRCAGVTEWLRAAALAAAHGLDVSAHTAPQVHATPWRRDGRRRGRELSAVTRRGGWGATPAIRAAPGSGGLPARVRSLRGDAADDSDARSWCHGRTG